MYTSKDGNPLQWYKDVKTKLNKAI